MAFEIEGLNSIPLRPARKGKNKSEKEISDFAQIKCLSDLERASREVIWQNFEMLTAYIFEQNDFLGSSLFHVGKLNLSFPVLR